MWGHSLWELFQRGGLVMWPLLAFSIVAFAIVVERAFAFLLQAGSYQAFVKRLHERLGSDSTGGAALQYAETDRTPLGRLTQVYLLHRGESEKSLDERLGLEASQSLASMEQRLHWLSVIGAIAPMLGLLGTVLGLVEAFHQIEVQGGQVQPGDLAAGIWKALLTTVYGLIVALPTLAAWHLLQQRVSTVALQMQWLTARLNGHFSRSKGAEETQA